MKGFIMNWIEKLTDPGPKLRRGIYVVTFWEDTINCHVEEISKLGDYSKCRLLSHNTLHYRTEDITRLASLVKSSCVSWYDY